MPGTRYAPVQAIVRLLEVFNLPDEDGIRDQTLEIITESFDAEVAAVVCVGHVLSAIGLGPTEPDQLVEAVEEESGPFATVYEPLGNCFGLSIPLDGSMSATLVLLRTARAFDLEETAIIRAMGRMMGLAARTLGAVTEERRTTSALETHQNANRELAGQLRRRHMNLMERVIDLQRAVTSSKTGDRTLATIVKHASGLLGEDGVVLRLNEPVDGSTVHVFNMPPDEERLRTVIGERGIAVIEEAIAAEQLAVANETAAMAAPVYRHGEVIGVLSVHGPGRTEDYDGEDKESLLIAAGYASVAVTDAVITQQLQASLAEAEWRADHDHLTGLFNREGVVNKVEAMLTSGVSPTLFYLDFDGFKTVNDLWGHATGDQALITMARRLTSSLRHGEWVSRLAGDEFLVVLPELDVAQSHRVARRLAALLSAPFEVDGRQLVLPPSIGVASGPARNAEDLLDAADLAMYKAKRSSGERIAFYDDALRRRRNRRVDLEQRLRLSVASMDDFGVQFQPIVNGSSEMVAAEALIRWRDPEVGLIPPDDFIGVAEETGSVTQIDFWALRRALAEATACGLPDLGVRISVNFSPASFLVPNVAEMVALALEEHGTNPSLLAIEITERVMLADHRAVVRNLEALRAMGVAVVLDDFGTGYSSLSYLRTLDVDGVKIDREFVAGAVSDPRGEAILRAVISLAVDLGSLPVAEGVEFSEQVDLLRSLGCHLFQGFYYGRPMAATDLTAWSSTRSGAAEGFAR